MTTISVQRGKSDVQGPPQLANLVETTLVNEMMLVSFAFFDPARAMAESSAPDAPAIVEANAFSQIAVPRTAFAQWLVQVVEMVSKLGDRDTFQWQEIDRIVTESRNKPLP